VAVHNAKAKLSTKGGAALYAHPGRSMAPLEAVFRFGPPPVQEWLKANKWKPEWPYNNNFKDRKPAELYDRYYQQMCPLYGGRDWKNTYAVLGGWHFPWPDGDWAELTDRPLLVWTFADSEPWVEVWGNGKGFEVKQRIT
jgi:hypothetical protein